MRYERIERDILDLILNSESENEDAQEEAAGDETGEQGEEEEEEGEDEEKGELEEEEGEGEETGGTKSWKGHARREAEKQGKEAPAERVKGSATTPPPPHRLGTGP